jgi:dTMP kinase
MKKGKFVVIYGANNIGKSTQVKLLAERLKKRKTKVKLLKYPIYDLEPTGPMINKFLRGKTDMSEYDAQKIFVQNRRDFEQTLKSYLQKGYLIIAEDYRGTGICWGATHGVPLDKMIQLNEGLLEEDLAILMDSEKQFEESIEKGHHNEDNGVWIKGRDMHRKVRKMFGWIVVSANQDVEKVHQDIWKIVKRKLLV